MPDILVEQYTGTDSQKLTAAHLAALKQLPSTLILPDRDFHLSHKYVGRVGVSLKGYGRTRSRILPTFFGGSTTSGSAPYVLGLLGEGLYPTEYSDFGVEGQPESYYRLIIGAPGMSGVGPSDFTIQRVRAAICGQSFIQLAKCKDSRILGFEGPYGGDNSYDRASAKYKIGLIGCSGVELAGLVMGEPGHNKNQSFVTIGSSVGVRVHHSDFYGTRTYALNTHGQGSHDIVFEDNVLQPGDPWFAAILVGNEYYGRDWDVHVRNNVMVGGNRLIQLRGGSEVIVSGNTKPLCTDLVDFGLGGGEARLRG